MRLLVESMSVCTDNNTINIRISQHQYLLSLHKESMSKMVDQATEPTNTPSKNNKNDLCDSFISAVYLTLAYLHTTAGVSSVLSEGDE